MQSAPARHDKQSGAVDRPLDRARVVGAEIDDPIAAEGDVDVAPIDVPLCAAVPGGDPCGLADACGVAHGDPR